MANSKKHRKRILQIFNGMKQRCYNENSINYKNYGAQGIMICSEWLSNKDAFVEWSLANGYKHTLSIDRIDGNGNYEPSNCRWACRVVQNNNTSRNIFITYNGETHTIAEWARITGISYSALLHRVQRGWDSKKIIEQPQGIFSNPKNFQSEFGKGIRFKKNRYEVYVCQTYGGRYKTLLEAKNVRDRIFKEYHPNLDCCNSTYEIDKPISAYDLLGGI